MTIIKTLIVPPRLIKGDSMDPFIKRGCSVKVNTVPGKLFIGDVVLILKNKKILIHRIIGKKKGKFLIKGDNLEYIDGYFPKKQIVGKVEKIFYPEYTINLKNKKNNVIKYFFVIYSILNNKFKYIRKIKNSYKIPIIKKTYRLLLKS